LGCKVHLIKEIERKDSFGSTFPVIKSAGGKDSAVFRQGKIPLDSAFPSQYNDKVRDNVTHSFYDA